MHRSIKRTAPVAALMLLLAACGGGGNDGAKKTSSATPVLTATTGDKVPDVSQGGVLDAAGLTQQCLSYAAYAGAAGLAMAAAMDPSAAAALEELKTKVKLDEAPEEIRDDFEWMIGYAQGLGEVLARYPLKAGQYNPAAIAAITEFSKGIDADRMTEAGESINGWLAANCPG